VVYYQSSEVLGFRLQQVVAVFEVLHSHLHLDVEAVEVEFRHLSQVSY